MISSPLWSKWQRRGFVVLLFLGVALFVTWRIKCHLRSRDVVTEEMRSDTLCVCDSESRLREFDPNKEDSAGLVSLGMKPWIARNICKYRSRGGRFQESEDLRKIYGMDDETYHRLVSYIRIRENRKKGNNTVGKNRLREFDPNEEDSAGLVLLGMKPWVARNVCRYRERGGRFRRTEDLGKIYGMDEALVERLMPYVRIKPNVRERETDVRNGDTIKNRRNQVGNEKEKESVDTKGEDDVRLVLNVVNEEDLFRSKGVGKKIGSRIIRYGQALGGYRNVNQLEEALEGLDKTYVEKIKKRFDVDTSRVKKINVNRSSVARMSAHPYMNFFEAKAIYEYRREHGRIKTLEQLRKIDGLNELFFERALPYLIAE